MAAGLERWGLLRADAAAAAQEAAVGALAETAGRWRTCSGC